MMDQGDNGISCPACRRAYHWQDALAGKTVRCQCGEVFNFPDLPDRDLHSTPDTPKSTSLDDPAMSQPADQPQVVDEETSEQSQSHVPDQFSMDFPEAQPAAASLPIPAIALTDADELVIEPHENTESVSEAGVGAEHGDDSQGVDFDLLGKTSDGFGDAQGESPATLTGQDATSQPFPADGKCPSCNLKLKELARVCLNCGYSLDKRSKIQTQVLGADRTQADVAASVGASRQPMQPSRSRDRDTQKTGAPGEPPSHPTLSSTETGASLSVIAGPPPDSRYSTKRREVRVALQSREDDTKASAFIEKWLPGIFILMGPLLTLGEARLYVEDGSFLSLLPDAAMLFATKIVITLPLVFGGALLTVRLLGTSYGSLKQALYKFTAISIGPLALGDLAVAYINMMTMGIGALFGYTIYIVLFVIPLAVLFDLDLLECTIILVFVVLSRIIMLFVGVMVLLS